MLQSKKNIDPSMDPGALADLTGSSRRRLKVLRTRRSGLTSPGHATFAPVDPPAFGGYTHGSKRDRERPGDRAKPFAPTAPARSAIRFIKAAAADSPRREKEGAMPKRAAENGADASAKKAKKAPKNVGDDIIKLESDSEGDGIPVPVAKKAAKKEAARLRKKIAGAFGREKDERPKVLYIGHVLHGFYEQQMRGYFSQFGEVTRLRLSRNKKTGKSKHYAFVEFKHPEVAQIVAESMNGYLLFESVLKVRTMTEAECHPEMWKGANRSSSRCPGRRRRRTSTTGRGARMSKRRGARRSSGERRRRKKIADAGIEYDFPGYASVGNGAGDDVGTATEKRPAKKTPAKRSAAARRSRRPRRDPRLRPRRRGPRRSGPRGVLRLDREMNERKGGGEDEAASDGDDDAEDASARAPARDDEVSRGERRRRSRARSSSGSRAID